MPHNDTNSPSMLPNKTTDVAPIVNGFLTRFLDPEGGSQKATLVVLVVIRSLKRLC